MSPTRKARDLIDLSAIRSRSYYRSPGISSLLIEDSIFRIGIGCLFTSICYTFFSLCFFRWPVGSCSTGDLTFPLFFFVFPIWSLGHALVLRQYEYDMEPMHLFYNCTLGLSISIISTILAIWISVLAWKCSNSPFKVSYICCVLISALWIFIWLRVFYQRFVVDEKNNNLSYLLILRCACVPAGVRKIAMVAPIMFFSFIYSLEAKKHW